MPPPEPGQLIVFVDDDIDSPFLFSRLLRKAALDIRLVPLMSGPDAISFFERAGTRGGGVDVPLIAFLNLRMPATDGLDVLRWIRRHESLARMPVVMTSDLATPPEIRLAASLGAQAFVRKFPEPVDLRRLVQDAAGFRTTAPAADVFDMRCNLLLRPESLAFVF